MRTLRKVFLGGLAAVVPLAVTVYILYWMGSTAEALFGHLFKAIWSEERYLERLLRRVEHMAVKVRLKAIPPMDPVKAVLRESENYDLVVLGLSGSFLRQVGVPTLAEQIARHCSTPLVLAKASKGLSALTKRWI